MDQLFSFIASCPQCKRECAIERYDRRELGRLLELGHPIEGSCAQCAARWLIGPEMRTQIARLVAVEPFAALGPRARSVIDLTLLPLARLYRWQRQR
jgi:hypothetical protein